MSRRGLLFAVVVLLGTHIVSGAAATRPATPDNAPMTALWVAPTDLASRDLYNGPWGAKFAPDPKATYTFVRRKTSGVNPGVIVRDPAGRIWHVKQSAHDRRGDEGPAEVAISRVLSAVGYHQPPVYFMPSFIMADKSGVHREAGGRFRLDEPSLRSHGSWAWTQNPFVGTRPHQGLLVMLLAFNSFDLKDSNNTLYEFHQNGQTTPWYVVRDLGGALGSSGTVWVKRNSPDQFEDHPFITGIDDNYVEFNYAGHQPRLVREQITVDDLRWATALLAGLSDHQWEDAFRAGGYAPAISARFIRQIKMNILRGQQLADPGRQRAHGKR